MSGPKLLHRGRTDTVMFPETLEPAAYRHFRLSPLRLSAVPGRPVSSDSHFKCVDDGSRSSVGYHELGIRDGDQITWFRSGLHSDGDKIVRPVPSRTPTVNSLH